VTTAPATSLDAGARGEVGRRKLTLLALVALVFGSMVGGGVFDLPGDLSAAAAPGAILTGWAISGVGMLMLALVYRALALRRPDLGCGPYAYARAGFGPFSGFQSAWGYWVSGWVGNVSYAIAIFGSLSFFAPVFGSGDNFASVVGASVVLWSLHAVALRGVARAAVVNIAMALAKLVPLMLFVLIVAMAFNADKLVLNLGAVAGGADGLGEFGVQVRSTMVITLWAFVGVEAASVYAARADRRADIGRATLVGFAGALALYVLISMLSTGVLARNELADLPPPSMAGVLESLVGPWGADLIALGLVASVGGAFLCWMLLCAEIPCAAAKDGTFPRWFAVENPAGAPANALWFTNGLVQLCLIVTLFVNPGYRLLYTIASAAILPTYLFSVGYALRLALKDDGRDDRGRRLWSALIAGAAAVYGTWLCYAVGLHDLLLTSIIFGPAVAVYVVARRERGLRIFTVAEGVVATGLAAVAAATAWALFAGVMTL